MLPLLRLHEHIRHSFNLCFPSHGEAVCTKLEMQQVRLVMESARRGARSSSSLCPLLYGCKSVYGNPGENRSLVHNQQINDLGGGGAWVPDRLQSDVQATVTKRPQQLGRGLFKGEANGASQTDWAAHVAALPSVSDSKMGTYAASPKLRNWEGAHHPRQQSERKPAYLVNSEIIRASTFNPGTCRKWQPDALGRAWP